MRRGEIIIIIFYVLFLVYYYVLLDGVFWIEGKGEREGLRFFEDVLNRAVLLVIFSFMDRYGVLFCWVSLLFRFAGRCFFFWRSIKVTSKLYSIFSCFFLKYVLG